MRIVPLTDYQKATLRALVPLLVRLRLADEDAKYCPAWQIKVWQNAHGEVRIEYEELVAGQRERHAVYIFPAGTYLWRARGKEERRWKVKRELPESEWARLPEGV